MDRQIILTPLSRGKVALVDNEDYEWLSEHCWHIRSAPRPGMLEYVGRTATCKENPSGKFSLLMHRAVLGLERGDHRQGDHINFDTFDNRRSNLRIVTQEENRTRQNSRRGSSSQYVGVTWVNTYQIWYANLMHKGKNTTIGAFQTELAAALARDVYVLINGLNHTLSFPTAPS